MHELQVTRDWLLMEMSDTNLNDSIFEDIADAADLPDSCRPQVTALRSPWHYAASWADWLANAAILQNLPTRPSQADLQHVHIMPVVILKAIVKDIVCHIAGGILPRAGYVKG
jgi:hypothetical protein